MPLIDRHLDLDQLPDGDPPLSRSELLEATLPDGLPLGLGYVSVAGVRAATSAWRSDPTPARCDARG